MTKSKGSQPTVKSGNETGNAIIIALVVLVVIAIGAVAYLSGQIGGGDEAQTPAAQTAAATPNAPEAAPTQTEDSDAEPVEIKPGNPVVATEDGKDITRLDVFGYIQSLGPQAQQTPLDQLFPAAVNQVVNAEIINEKVSGVNLDNDPAVKQQLAAAKEQIVRGVYIQQQVEKAMTDERLKAAYDVYVANFPEIPELKTRHILVKEEDLAKDLTKQLKEGADFAALAQEHSIDATKEKGGELGYISKEDQVIPVFLETIFKMDVGEMTKKPVKSEFGYHIIEVLDERMRPAATFDQAKPFLAAQIRGQVLNEVITSWRNEADVTVLDINGEPIEPAAGEEAPAEEAPAAEAAPAEEAPAE